jgi:O-antigen ligase
MQKNSFQNSQTAILAIGAPLITVFLLFGNVTDPVNAPKLFLLGGTSGAAFALLTVSFLRGKEVMNFFDLSLLAFLVWGLVAAIMSESPISLNIYGLYGRNTGWLAYCFFAGLALTASRIRGTANFNRIILGFFFALSINLIYGTWVLLFGDFLGWNNIYGALLGTFGNPNFISSFLGMSFSALFALIVGANKKIALICIAILPIVAFQLIKAASLQGIVVSAIGIWIVGFLWLRGKFESRVLSWNFFGTGSVVGLIGVLGALGHGPFKQALAQPTVALREQYWIAAWHMAKEHPILGVGMDSYGDWYRRARGPQALITPGPNTVTNASHNVFLDLLAYGGFPLFVIYLIFVGFGLVSIMRVVHRMKKYDSTFVTLTVIWVGFQAQSIISINQIGLAIWGWLLTGLLVGYEIDSRDKVTLRRDSQLKQPKPKFSVEIFSPKIIGLIGLVAGFILAVPPLSADIKWRSVQTSGLVVQLESAFSDSYMAPLNSYTLANSVLLLENNKMPDLAIKYARQGVVFNPNYFDAWKTLYYATRSSPAEKSQARLEMIRLDPLNPEWKKLA